MPRWLTVPLLKSPERFPEPGCTFGVGHAHSTEYRPNSVLLPESFCVPLRLQHPAAGLSRTNHPIYSFSCLQYTKTKTLCQAKICKFYNFADQALSTQKNNPPIGGLFGIQLVQRLHGGDLGEVKFTTLCNSTYPYFVALLLTFKLHKSTYPFTQSVSVDVTCDVSDVNSTFREHLQYSMPPCRLQEVMLLQSNCPDLQILLSSVPLLHRHRCSAWWRYPHDPRCPA